jgi:nickel/cobalt exporter
MRMLQPIAIAALLIVLGASPASAAGDGNFWVAAFTSLIDWQRGIVQEIGRILILVRDGASLIALVSSAGLAFLYGLLSEFSSGHGKLVAAAYFAGRPARLVKGFWMSCQIGLVNAAAAAILVGSAEIGWRSLFGGTPAHSIWLRLAAFAVIGAVGFFFALHTVRAKMSNKADAIEEQDARLERVSHFGLIGAMGLIPKAGAVLVLVFTFANDIAGTGLILASAVSAGMATTIFIFAASGMGLHRLTLAFADEGTPMVASLGVALRLAGALAILILAISFSALVLMNRYS